jgi:hypothetical protein
MFCTQPLVFFVGKTTPFTTVIDSVPWMPRYLPVPWESVVGPYP